MPALTITGSPTLNGDGTCTIDSTGSDGVSALTTGMDETQGWWAARLVMGYPNTQNNGGDLYWARWADGGSDYIYAAWRNNDGGAGGWSFGRQSGGSGSEGSWLGDTFSAGAHRTIIMRWTATEWAGSLNGAAFSALGNTNIPTLADTALQIGHRGNTSQINSAYYWFAWGAGTLTDADAARINGWGDNDPSLAWFAPSAAAQGTWAASSFVYSAFWDPVQPVSRPRRRSNAVSW